MNGPSDRERRERSTYVSREDVVGLMLILGRARRAGKVAEGRYERLIAHLRYEHGCSPAESYCRPVTKAGECAVTEGMTAPQSL